jgi:uncharacterized protein (DUF305 family)
MGLCVRLIASALLWRAATASGQSSSPAPESAPIVQPGAPGQSSKRITAAEAAPPLRAPSPADVSFMQGMIMHHSQAVKMTDLLRVRTHSKELLELGKRISISQTDEMKYMKQWLDDRGAPVSMERSPMHSMSDMKTADSRAHMNMGSMPMNSMTSNSMRMMPGMLTPQQMMALEQARGASFDHLFLTGMIQHHTGALVMVKDLFDTPGAGQDAVLFDFATDVDNTQRAEIDIMRSMLLKEKK